MIQDTPPPSPQVLSLSRLNPNVIPSVKIDGKKMRVVSLTVVGDPAVIAAAKAKVMADGWAISVVSYDGRVMQVATSGKSLEEIAALDFQFQIGNFGEVKTTPFIVPDFK